MQRKETRVENVYNDTSVLRKSAEISQLQAFCTPIQAGVVPQKPKKAMLDYSQYASSKAPSAPKNVHATEEEKNNFVERTKAYLSSLASKQSQEQPQYVKDNREVIKKYHDQQNSLYGTKVASTKPPTAAISTSTECFSFRPPIQKSVQHAALRKSMGSAPGNNAVAEQRTFKIFQSDKQSANREEMGTQFPGPPPPSPVPGISQDMFDSFKVVFEMCKFL